MPKEPLPRVALVVVAQGEYANWDPLTQKGWEPLTQARKAAEELAEALGGRHYALELPELLQGGTKEEVERALVQWFQARSPSDRIVLYWTGHGAPNERHYLVTRESPRQGELASWNAYATRNLGEVIAKSKAEKVLVVLDTCFSSGAVPDVAADLLEVLKNRTILPGQQRYVAFLPSAHALEKAQEAVLCRALVKLFTGDDSRVRRWTDQDQFIPVADLVDALTAAVQEMMGPDW